MYSRYLLTIEDVFDIEGRGILLLPALPFINSKFRPFNTEVLIEDDSGNIVCEALFAAEHLLLLDKCGKWQILPILQNINKSDIKVGSKVYVRDDVYAMLHNID